MHVNVLAMSKMFGFAVGVKRVLSLVIVLNSLTRSVDFVCTNYMDTWVIPVLVYEE